MSNGIEWSSSNQFKPFGASVVIEPETGQARLTQYGEQLVQEYAQAGQQLGKSKTTFILLAVIIAVLIIVIFVT